MVYGINDIFNHVLLLIFYIYTNRNLWRYATVYKYSNIPVAIFVIFTKYHIHKLVYKQTITIIYKTIL